MLMLIEMLKVKLYVLLLLSDITVLHFQLGIICFNVLPLYVEDTFNQ
jgi:hypothetical protein